MVNTSADTPHPKFTLWDSLSQSNREIPLQCQKTQKALAWYTCGPTTYATMHLGHARTYVWFDMMRRVLEFIAKSQGTPSPLFVMNITDIDDKILAASAETSGQDYQCPITISRRAEASFFKDMDRLGCQRPHVTTRVTEFVESDIVPYIERLVQQGMAYASQGGVYFDVRAFEANVGASSYYGKLAGMATTGQPETEEISSSSTTKRDKRDFALWKFRKEGEGVYWSSPWGDGRPGWHIECSAMIEAVQEKFRETHQFLVHAGGLDLKFPHHTNEIAQAEAYHYGGDSCSCISTVEWIPYWVHTGHLMVQQDKMSKSLKNFLTVDELWFSHATSSSSHLSSPADDFRWWCLTGGTYGQRQEYSRSKILSARRNREKILRFLLDGEQWMDQWSEQTQESDDNMKQWSNADHELFVTVSNASTDAYRALLNNMQGSQYASSLIEIASAGNVYLRQFQPSATTNLEPIKAALKNIRGLLSLVGFSNLTINAGLENKDHHNKSTSYVVGGEKAILEELVKFRALVRAAALEDIKSKNGTANAKAIMKACDNLRESLPGMGVEVMDTKEEKGAQWRFCLPTEERKE